MFIAVLFNHNSQITRLLQVLTGERVSNGNVVIYTMESHSATMKHRIMYFVGKQMEPEITHGKSNKPESERQILSGFVTWGLLKQEGNQENCYGAQRKSARRADSADFRRTYLMEIYILYLYICMIISYLNMFLFNYYVLIKNFI